MKKTVTIEIDDREVRTALGALQARMGNLRPALDEVGEVLLDRIMTRFARSQAPDGTPWAANSPTTLDRYLSRFGGTRKKDGSLSKKGAARAAAKKPLIGESRTLSTSFFTRTDETSLTIGNPTKYAATHQFGAKRGEFGRTKRGSPIPWGNIPARPFLPITAQGELVPAERETILDIIADYLEGD